MDPPVEKTPLGARSELGNGSSHVSGLSRASGDVPLGPYSPAHAATAVSRGTRRQGRIDLCGTVSVALAGRRLDEAFSGARARLCLGYLALHRDRPVRRDELIEAVWGDRAPENPDAALATLLSRIRRALGPDVVQGRGNLQLVLPGDVRIDVEEADEAVERAESRLEAGDLVGASRAAAAAAEVSERELLPGLEGDWLDSERAEFLDVRLRALECRAEAALRLRGPALAAAERAARELIRVSPYREPAHRLLMRALAARGDTAQALAAYEELRALLREELGTTPSAQTLELHRRLLAGEVDEAPSPAPDGRGLSGTLTILAAELGQTDIAASSLGEDAAAAARVTGMQLLRDAGRTSEGRALHEAGDRIVVAFDSVLKALSCATLMQQFVSHHAQVNSNRALTVSCGVSVEEVLSREGLPPAGAGAAARELCRQAEPEQVLVGDLVPRLTPADARHEFTELERRDGEGDAASAPVYEMSWRPAATDAREPLAAGAARGADPVPLDAAELDELDRILELSGVKAPLAGRYTVVFAYPGQGVGDLHLELSGCTTEICAILEETTSFEQHGVHVIGVSTEPSAPPPGCAEITFPVGVVPQDELGGVLPVVERGGRRYAARTSFVVFPDRSGVRIAAGEDVIGHVRRSFDVAIARRLGAYQEAMLAHLARGSRLRSSADVPELLERGADSVGIPRVEVKLDLVSKLALAEIVAAEAGYIDRINRLFEEQGLERLFPAVVAICTDEDPAWYLMEAVNPVPLDRLAFADDERTVLSDQGRELLAGVLERIGSLYELTLRQETPAVARYHYLERFAAIPRREDTQATFQSLVGGDLESMLRRELVIDSFACRPFRDQLAFLESNVEALLEPVGAYVHGDLHLPNMLLDEKGESVVLIDPRVVWDGNDVGDPGFCDPLYDLATLLHSVHAMSPILRAIESGATERLLEVEDAGPPEPLVLGADVLRLHDNPVVEWFADWVEHVLPRPLLSDSWRARLHIGAANAFMGWLKYARSMQTRDAWLATYAAVAYHLECGRRELERSEKGDAP